MSLVDEQLEELRGMVASCCGGSGGDGVGVGAGAAASAAPGLSASACGDGSQLVVKGRQAPNRHIKLVSQKKCNFCNGWSNTVVRVFASEEAFQASPYYGGGDLVINDPHASRAVWPGKTNANRETEDWWICLPVHPYCSCHWNAWVPGEEDRIEGLRNDLFGEDYQRPYEKDRAERAAAQEVAIRENREANRAAHLEKSEMGDIVAIELALLRERMRSERFERSQHVIKGVMHQHSCACHHLEEEVETDSWTLRYLEKMKDMELAHAE